MNKKLHFFQSIHFKIALVFALLLFLAFQIVGAVFVQRLKSENLKQFKQSVEMPAYVNNLLVTQLNEADTSEANERIKTILDDINNNNISYCIERKQVKNINIRIKSDGIVYISANKNISEKMILSVLEQKIDFIMCIESW